MTKQNCREEMNPDRDQVEQAQSEGERMPFYLSLGQRVQSFQLAQMSILEGLPAAAQVMFTHQDDDPPDEDEDTTSREQE